MALYAFTAKTLLIPAFIVGVIERNAKFCRCCSQRENLYSPKIGKFWANYIFSMSFPITLVLRLPPFVVNLTTVNKKFSTLSQKFEKILTYRENYKYFLTHGEIDNFLQVKYLQYKLLRQSKIDFWQNWRKEFCFNLIQSCADISGCGTLRRLLRKVCFPAQLPEQEKPVQSG